MPEYAPGTPSWVELSSPDPDASAAFYRELMNWSATAPGPVEETGGYRMFQQDGRNIAGLMGHMQEGQPTVWSTYFSVRDADETAEKVRAAGGSVVVEPTDVMDIGRMAVFGWTPGRPSFEAPESYTIWELDGRPVGGMMEMTEEFFPPDVPPHWGVCFAVADCDATVAKARELGATVAAEPMSMPIGRFAGLVDPQGAPFAVMQLAPGG
jgi:predicted enzyme related to lactoylglutathione lyase